MDTTREPTPNWFASVMGTGMVAIASSAVLPANPAAHGVGIALFLAAAGWLLLLLAAWVRPAFRLGRVPFGSLDDPTLQHFYGAPAMAVLTIGAGSVAFGPALIGPASAIRVGAGLWVVGTVAGLVTAAAIPLRVPSWSAGEAVVPAWLLPVVPPMVSAATGARLVAYVPVGPLRVGLLCACYGLFAISALASGWVIARLIRRLLHSGTGPLASHPTLWIVVGPLGQSITATSSLGSVSQLAVPPQWSGALRSFAIGYGTPVAILAVLWIGFAASVTGAAVRRGLPFSLAWWSFTFPVGTCVTGAIALGGTTGWAPLQSAGGALLILLVFAWAIVTARTAAAGLRGHRRPGPRADEVDRHQQVGICE